MSNDRWDDHYCHTAAFYHFHNTIIVHGAHLICELNDDQYNSLTRGVCFRFIRQQWDNHVSSSQRTEAFSPHNLFTTLLW